MLSEDVPEYDIDEICMSSLWKELFEDRTGRDEVG